ncbi:ABC transporter ATP-binding protein [Nitrosomonas ureae]|uniref:ABC-2 type transport system ATP-binding protein n=1 Tax=Nitrosomonas ureae TaxID=44577 RepID=A0A1H9AAA1_9PROT|nr:ABC transporter ATP-binding protein [Nitrosomonas ureae]PXX11403.1 ABC-2 type transport system ATP-binding protein [Nitrosomonas ureae]SEP73363.1 ABC-2 type transport system ATP-binding protein [Nitrosomonas ureae]
MLPAIEITRVCKNFGGIRALVDIDLEIRPGEFFALLGPNGAGKTTLINIIAGLSLANSGSVNVMGYNVTTQYQQARRNLGVVPQELVFDPFFSVREVLLIQSGYYGIKHNNRWVDEIIERLDLVDKANANMRALSGGMKRRVLVAQALVHKPPVIILDEPTAGVDVELRQTLWEFIKQLNQDGHTIVLTTHYLEEAETLCSRVAMLKEGKIIALDSTQSLIGKLPSGNSLKIRLLPDRLPLELQSLQRSCSNGLYELRIDNYAQIEFILSTLRTENTQIQEMYLQQPDLEDAFVSLIRNSGNKLQ